jgi:hypothetical protein
MQHLVRSLRVTPGLLLALAMAVCACDLSPQPLPPSDNTLGAPRANPGSTADAAAAPGSASSGAGSSGSSMGAGGSGSSSGSAGGGNAPPVSTVSDAGFAAADAAGPDATGGAEAGGAPDAGSGGLDVGAGEAGGDAGSGDGAAAEGGRQGDGGMWPDDGGTAALCDSGCSRQASAGYCSAPKVEWLCTGRFDQSTFESACAQVLTTNSIRYCCPADFRRQCR